jgi:TPR repeat protein
MIRFRWPLAFVSVLALAVPPPGTALSAARIAVQSTVEITARSPLLVMCEGDGCSRWEFHSGHATATFSDGAVASLTIVDYPSTETGKVTIRRVDRSGVGKGIVGTYTGTRKGPMFQGSLDWKWPGHPDGHADWFAFLLVDSVHMAPAAASKNTAIPAAFDACEDGHACATWHFNGTTGNIPGIANLTVERFDDSLVVIRRNEISGALKGMEAQYIGIRSGDAIHGVATWKWSGQPPVGVVGWHASLAPAKAPATTAGGPMPPPPPIAKIVDAVVADQAPQAQPPPAAQWQPKKNVATVDLNGTWEREGLPAGQSQKISIFQLRDHLVGKNLGGRQYFAVGAQMFRADFTGPATAKGPVRGEDLSAYQIIDAFDGTFTVPDADHLQVALVSDGRQLPSIRYHRLSSSPVEDVPCDASNPRHISGDSALDRADNYLAQKDLAAANCWFWVGAAAGNVDARTEYGRSLYDGRGLPQNPPLGVYWLQQAAMQASVRSYSYMFQLFRNGQWIPRSEQRRNYWFARYSGLNPDLAHDSQHNSLRDWMLQTVRPCQASNPTHVNAGDALNMGRAAFMARSFAPAHCWMRISAEEGNLKASAYLGLISVFGMGVRPNTKNAFDYLHTAARGGDADAAIYLANFLRYGIGTPPDDNAARDVMQYAMNRQNGMNEFSRLEGSLVNFEAWEVMLSVPYSPDQNCLNDERRRAGGGRPDNCYNATEAARVDEQNEKAVQGLKDASQKTVLDNAEEVYPEEPWW